MNKPALFVCAFAASLMPHSANPADGPTRSVDGVYVQYLASHQSMGRLVYVVDSVAQLCFAKLSTGEQILVLIPCAKLTKRPEWRAIVTWEPQ